MDNLLKGNFIRYPPFGQPLILFLILGLVVLLGLALPRLSAPQGFILTLVIIGAYTACNYLLFSRLDLQLELFYPLLAVGLSYVGISVQRLPGGRAGTPADPQGLRVLRGSRRGPGDAEASRAIAPGGERREITILFTDIRGFTAMSEKLDPESLVRLLHDFLNPMSNIIIDQGGTIDKYMGDAIMALFGAPLVQPDHPRLACRAALEMVASLRALNLKWQAEGRPPLKVGVGINSGPVAVGNMGSDRLFDYTAIGDNVNLASRLEGLNKYYGTSILISQSTATLLGDAFILREVDLVRVKGKAQAIGFFEVLGEGEAPPELARFLETYHRGLALYRERNWPESLAAFTAALELHPEDASVRRYLEQAQKYMESPPGPIGNQSR